MKGELAIKIQENFKKAVQSDKRVKNAYLLVSSDKLGIYLNLAEGTEKEIHPQQPNYMASVGKLFTSAVIGILNDKKELTFNDKISKYLDKELIDGLHVYKGKEYSEEIKVKHLLNQSSGLNDVFFHLWKKISRDPRIKISTREAIIWGKKNLKPKFVPGKSHFYTDTNYYLLGLIAEKVMKKPFHEIMHQLIFESLDMKHAFMNGFSSPAIKSDYPVAKLCFDGVSALKIDSLAEIDYAGGGVIAPLDEYLKFMKALVENRVVKKETLQEMLNDTMPMRFPGLGFDYGYAIWKIKPIPLFIPKGFDCWGCVGITGAFMFYHPGTESYIIGTFNDSSYKSKAIRFMLSKVIKELLEANKNHDGLSKV